MPIHATWKPMAQGMKSTYGAGNVCRDFTDGTSVCMCTKAWTVFFATLNKHGWKDTSPTPKSFSATVAEEAIEETLQEFQDWYDETKKRKKHKRHKKKKRKATTTPIIVTNPPTSRPGYFHPILTPHINPPPLPWQLTVGKEDYFDETDGEPRWVALARKIIASKKTNAGMKAYWQKRLDAYKGDCPKVKKK